MYLNNQNNRHNKNKNDVTKIHLPVIDTIFLSVNLHHTNITKEIEATLTLMNFKI